MRKKILLILFFTITVIPLKVIYAAMPISTINGTAAVGRNELQIQNQEKSSMSSTPANPVTPPAGLISQEKIKKIITRIGEFADRIEKINLKINNRIDKLKKNKVKTTAVAVKYTTLTRQIKLLNTEIEKLNNLLTDFGQSTDPKKDYPQLKKQLTSVNNKLIEIITGQKEITVEMGKYGSISATPTGATLKGNL